MFNHTISMVSVYLIGILQEVSMAAFDTFLEA